MGISASSGLANVGARAVAGPFNAHPDLSNGTGAPGQWVATGNTYARGLNDVDIWVFDLTDGSSILEYQSGLSTSSASLIPYSPGGLFSAAGKTERVLIDPDVGYRTEAVDPLKCGHQYEATTYDPIDGNVNMAGGRRFA